MYYLKCILYLKIYVCYVNSLVVVFATKPLDATVFLKSSPYVSSNKIEFEHLTNYLKEEKDKNSFVFTRTHSETAAMQLTETHWSLNELICD